MNELNVERLGKALSDILSRKYDAKITVTFIPKDQVREEENTQQLDTQRLSAVII